MNITQTFKLPNGTPYHVCHIPIRSWGGSYRRTGTKIKPSKIVWHNTGNVKNRSPENEVKNLLRESNTSSTSFHIVIGEDAVYEVIPLNEKSHHATVCNNDSIGIEVIMHHPEVNRDKVLDNCYNTAWFITRKRNLNIPFTSQEDMITSNKYHIDCSGKYCPEILLNTGLSVKGNILDGFKKAIFNKVTELDKPVNPPKPVVKSEWEIKSDSLVSEMINLNITDGTRLNEPTTRRESIVMLHRLYNLLKTHK